MQKMTYRLLSSGLLFLFIPAGQADLVVGEIDQLQQENIVLTQRARAAELEQRIRQAGGAPLSPHTGSPGPLQPAATVSASRAQLTGIQGARGHLKALVSVGNRQFLIPAGQTWPGSHLTLKTIQPDAVILSDGTRLSPGAYHDQ